MDMFYTWIGSRQEFGRALMSNPAVSVIIPTCNRVALLREALDSVAAQTFRDYETIVVDDGSTEDLSGLVKSHRVGPRLIRQTRGGPASARNRGVAAAGGKYLAFLDSDDLWLPTKLEKFVAALEAHPEIHLYYGPMQPVDSAGNYVKGRTKTCHSGWITEKLFRKCFVHVPTVVCRRELFVESGGFNESLPVCEDYELWLRISADYEFGLIEEPLALRRLHHDRLSKRDMHRNLAVKSAMLERFYLSGVDSSRFGGSVARQRLGRVFQAAARAAFFSGHFMESLEHCRKSASYSGSSIRLVPISVPSKLLCMLGAGQKSTHIGASREEGNPSYACRTFPAPEDQTSASAVR